MKHKTSTIREQSYQKTYFGKQDYSFLIFVCIWALFGLTMLLSASSYESEKITGAPQTFFLTQAATLGISFALMLLIGLMDYRVLRKLSWVLAAFSLIALVLVSFSSLGLSAGGSQRWLKIGALSFQPSEIAKISCLILMADGLANNSWRSLKVIKRFLFCFLIAVLILKQPDLGTAVLILASCGCLLLAGGLNLFLAISFVALALGGVILSVMKNPYQMQRITGWLTPEQDPIGAGYNLLQSHYAIGSGGVFGLGYGQSIQKLGYLPVSYSDFIFAIICEELGFIGVLLVIGGFLFLLWKGLQIAFRVPSNFGKLLGFGIIFSLIIQTIFNLGGVIGLLPVTGMPLPLISYGKTSVVVVGIMLGIFLNLSRSKGVKLNIDREHSEKNTLQVARL
ncbi:MAG: putative peptidoglycan glycosyltransferase FtsW [Candidatus Caenarcaniphilales bacterium]|nr:putative peptidoglycan glycosyltransferase FtsW [Candidatus Caenarcaniphilales bacterium]